MQAAGKKEIFEVKSSCDPVSNKIGVQGSYNLDAQAKKAVVHYAGKHGEFFLTADVYDLPGQPLYVVLFCPLCKNSLRIAADNKKVEFDEHEAPRFRGYRPEEVLAAIKEPSLGGALSVERFGCTWEAEPDLRRQHFAVCNWRVEIDRGNARDA